MKILEVSEYVVQYCFRKAEPPTMFLLNCYLFLMNAYSIREYKKPLATDAEFLFDRKYPYDPSVFWHYRSFVMGIVPPKNFTDSEMQRFSEELKMDGFLEWLVDFNKKNPFKIHALCGEYAKNHRPASTELSYNTLKELLNV